MKKIKLILLSFVAAFMFACNTLDVPPMNVVKDAEVFVDANGITAYMANMYATLPMIDRPDYGGRSSEVASQSILSNSGNNPALSDSEQGWWNYECIRAACYFIQEFPKYSDKFGEVQGKSWTGEAHFIRAMCHFGMVQRYGGIPIVDKVLDYLGGGIEDKYLTRSKEADCYDFILRDLTTAAELLPETSATNFGLGRGRVNKYAALALKARVALHAGCIARYAGETLNAWAGSEVVQKGLVGVPATRADEYFQIAWDAAKAVENSGRYQLYGAEPADEKAVIANYRGMYLPANDGSNKEFIFAKYYQYPNNAHWASGNCLPMQLAGLYTGQVSPTMDYVSLFDDVDGNPIDWDERLGNDNNYSQHLWADPADAFADTEPRFKAIILYPNAVFKNEVIEIQKGILRAGKFIDGAPFSSMNDVAISSDVTAEYTVDGVSRRIQGKSGIGNERATSTGFHCVKYMDESFSREIATANPSRDEGRYPEIRYAEVLLTLAEAAVELNRPNDAIPYMNAIRKRAGSKKIFDAVTIDDVRKERRMEFIWEAKNFWDLRRWRVFHKEFDNTSPRILWPIYVWDKKEYYMRITDTKSNNFSVVFDPKFYYMRIPDAEISKNGKLLPNNPGY